ncbi:DNA-directed RNA polymerase subunit beta [Candidatus Peregrinibacteria bacterium]|nr:DNA-directed RNA polymerase subunit beta [Candidatus Peregrinibacteria bacterium]
MARKHTSSSSLSISSSRSLKNLPFPLLKNDHGRLFFTEGDDDSYPLPGLIEVQVNSYDWFLQDGIKELLEEVSPITDFSGKKMELYFLKHSYDKPKFTASEAKRKNVSYEANLKVRVKLVNKETGEIKEQEVFLGAIPLMTTKGTFVVNGIERVVVNQLVRSPGAFFSKNPLVPGAYNAKVIPKRGVWLEVETDKKGVITVKIDRKRKIPVTHLLRVFGYDTDEKIRKIFEDMNVESNGVLQTLERDAVKTVPEAYQSIYRKIRPGDLATAENAKSLIDAMFHDFKRYDMGPIARYKLNKRFGTSYPNDFAHRTFQVSDFIHILRELIDLNNKKPLTDDIDHLSNRRVRSVGELVQNKFRVGLMRTDRIAKDRMTVVDLETVTPTQLINSRPITAAMREFYASSQLSQFMDQTNPLAELSHKRRLSAMGPGGLSRERASFDVRDVHASHYGRICPISTPEGPNIGLVVHLATYAKVNSYGFIETPFRTISNLVPSQKKHLVGRFLEENIAKVGRAGSRITNEMASKLLAEKSRKEVRVRAYLTDEVKYYDADEEKDFVVAQANTEIDELGQFLDSQVSARKNGEATLVHNLDVTHIDISPKQIISETTALIPFLEHDDNTRASMGSNMQRQAVPLLRPETPLVGTGFEGEVARASGQAVVAEEDGEVTSVDATQVTVLYESGNKKTYELNNFVRSNQATCFNMRPTVSRKQEVKKGDPLIDGSSVEKGEVALGRNLLVAYLPWNGYNFEDAIILSDRMVKDAVYDSIHIENFTIDVRDTKLGPEMITRDIPNVGSTKLKDLDSDGVVRIGSMVMEGDILVGKITPKGETELTPEERLLQAIFGEKAKDVKDTSLRLPGGEGGKVVDIQIFSRDAGDDLPQGVIKQVRVFVAKTRKIQVGDKMAGRHGNKGVVSKIVPVEDMPFLPDGTPVDIILNPLGVSSRMNIGQILETHLGWVASKLNVRFATPVLNGISPDMITQFLKCAELPEDGKVQLYDGRTGEAFGHKTTVGFAYIMKLSHLVEDKLHARSVGPYSIVTQQPLGGKAQHGGQRFGEMEVWALEAYGAAHTLQEMLTIKSDDVVGRAKAYESIVKAESIRKPNTPESFNVLVHELKSLCIDVDLMEEKEGEIEHIELPPEEAVEDIIPETDKMEELTENIAESEKMIEKEIHGDEIAKKKSQSEEEDSVDEEAEKEEEK